MDSVLADKQSHKGFISELGRRKLEQDIPGNLSVEVKKSPKLE